MNCKQCGSKVPKGAKFCNNCGAEIPKEPYISSVNESGTIAELIEKKKDGTKNWLKWILLAFYIILCPLTDWYFPFFVGLIGTPICLLILIIFAITHKKKKTLAMVLAFMVVSFVTGLFFTPSMTEEERAAQKCEELGHEYVDELLTASTCSEGGETNHICSRCGDAYIESVPAAGHTYSDEVLKVASCTEEGEVKRTCSVCGDEVIESIKLIAHDYVEKKTMEATCDKAGERQRICSICGDKKTETLSAFGHSWSAATCTTPKTCKVCGAIDGEGYGHSTDAGICSICNERVEKLSPVTIVGMRYTTDSVGGVEWTFKIRNNTDKEIKYITFQWTCYNAVGDQIRDEITGKTYVRIKYTGPLGAGETTGKKRNTTLFYNNTYNNAKINEITVEYMDGTTESINEFYYGFSD